MKAIKLDVKLFGKLSQEWSERALKHMLTALFEIDKDYLEFYPNTPPLYRSGIIYCGEEGTENWQPIPKMLVEGRADCEDLACYRAAELSVRGVDAHPFLRRGLRGNKLLYHVLVRLPNGSFEDPSQKLGMNDPRVEGVCRRWA